VDLEASPADDGAADGHECFVDVVADLPADPQPAEPVQQRDGLLHDIPVFAQPRAVRDAAAGDDRPDALGLHQGPVLVMVIGAVGEYLDRPPAGPAAAAADRRDRLDQRQQLGDVVAVPAGQRDRQRDARGRPWNDLAALAAGVGRSGGSSHRVRMVCTRYPEGWLAGCWEPWRAIRVRVMPARVRPIPPWALAAGRGRCVGLSPGWVPPAGYWVAKRRCSGAGSTKTTTVLHAE